MDISLNLLALPTQSYVEGIHDFKQDFTEEDIPNARGEFIGYVSSPDRLTLFRDRAGARNIYFTWYDNTAFVSNDILSLVEKLRERIGWHSLLNLDHIQGEYMEFQIPFGDRTIYNGINKVEPGSMFTFSPKQLRVEKKRYWELKFGEKSFNPLDLHDLIVDAVKFRKEKLDKPYTAYLSGGIDSSTITLLSQPKEVFSGFYYKEHYSELDYIKTAIKGTNIKPNPVAIDKEVFQRFFSLTPDIMPDPMCGLGVIPQLIIAMEAFKKGYYYSFTGEGGDEIFFGYPWNTAIIDLARTARFGLCRDRYMIRWEKLIDKIVRDGFLGLVATSISKGDRFDYAVSKISEVWDKSLGVENNVMKFNIKIGLPAILTVDERVGMVSGVTPVSPLVDHHIIEYVASVNPEERARIPKHLLREAMKSVLPEKIRTRYDKMGFPVPVESWSWPMIELLLETLRRRGIVKFNIDECKTMDRKTWALCQIEMIFRRLSNEDKSHV